jgi:hemerythrin-like domain-containing protein
MGRDGYPRRLDDTLGSERTTHMAGQGSSESHADVRTYRVVHDAFRLATTRFVDATGKLEPSALQGMIGSHWGFYDAVLDTHHHSEDNSIFPALLAVRPDMGALITRLEDDHQQLIRALDTVDSAIAAFEAQPDDAHKKTMHEAVVAVRDLFFPHLDTEDEQILPAIAESIPPKEWERLDKAALKAIPREHLPTAAGAIDELIQDLPEDERPPPPPLPLRIMLALSWRKKFAAWVEPLRV